MATNNADENVTPDSIADPEQPPVPAEPVAVPGYDCDPPQPPVPAE